METTRKPFGLVLTAIWAAVSGVLFVLGSLLMLIASQVRQVPELNGLIYTALGILCLAFGIILLAATYGLWSVQEWGRRTAFWLSAASIPLGAAAVFPIAPGQQITLGNTLLQIVDIGVDGAIMFYLSRARIKALFDN